MMHTERCYLPTEVDPRSYIKLHIRRSNQQKEGVTFIIHTYYSKGSRDHHRVGTILLDLKIYLFNIMKLLSLYLFALLAATETSTQFTCHDTTKPPSTTCTGTTCYSGSQENTIVGGSVEKYSSQTCLISCKEVNIKLTFGEKQYFRTATKCCGAHNCNTIPEVPPADNKESNLGCPACFAFSSTYCDATVIRCPESEDQCVNITGFFSDASGNKPFYGRGCTTPAAKNIALGDTIPTSQNSAFQILAISVEKATEKVFTCHNSMAAPTQTCIGTKCYSQSQENTIVGESGKEYKLQSCLPSCKESKIKFTFGEKQYFRAATICCEADNCNAVPPPVPSGDTKTSNLECPACSAFSSTFCDATVIKCPDSEDQCVNISGIFHEASGNKLFYGRGCTTPAAKSIAPGDTIATSQNSVFEIVNINVEKAKDSSWSVQGSFTVTLLLSGLIGIQLTNIF